MTTTRAIIALEPLVPGTPNFKLGNLTLRELRDDEVLVRIVASGVCHTDITIGSVPKGRWKYPKVLGHEGIVPLRWLVSWKFS